MLKPFGAHLRVDPVRFVSAAVAMAFWAFLWSASPASAAPVVHPTLVQTIDTSEFNPYSSDPAGIAYRHLRDQLVISDSEVNETGLYRGFNLFTATRTGSGFGSGTTLAYSREPTGLGLNPANGTLYVSDDDKDKIFVVWPGRDGVHGTADDVVSSFSTAAFGDTDPEDVAYDPASGHLFACDGSGIEIYDINPVNGTFGDGNDVVTHFDLARYGAGDCEGLGIDPSRNALLAVDEKSKAIYELSKSGDLLRILSLSAIPTAHQAVSDVTLAPTSNPGDTPSAMDYWITDRHVDNNATSPPPIDGLLYEMR
jgi:DNA-binding beta-propeller fold protein YncE